jgi:hypothetical protein
LIRRFSALGLNGLLNADTHVLIFASADELEKRDKNFVCLDRFLLTRSAYTCYSDAMKSTLVLLFLSFCLCACGSDSNSPSANNQAGGSQPPVEQVSNGVMDLGSSKPYITDMLDESQNNWVQPSTINTSINTVKAHFVFNSQDNSEIFVDPNLGNLVFCKGRPTVEFDLGDATGNSQQIQIRTRTSISSNTDYILNVTISNVNCTGTGNEALALPFGLRLDHQ